MAAREILTPSSPLAGLDSDRDFRTARHRRVRQLHDERWRTRRLVEVRLEDLRAENWNDACVARTRGPDFDWGMTPVKSMRCG